MYDILEKMKLLEGRGSKPDFLDLDRDGNRTEPMKDAAKEKVDEISLDGIGRGIGKAIGVPARVAGAVAGIPGGLKQAYQTSKSGAQKAISGQDVDCYPKGTKVAMEADMEEGNDFTGARLAAIRSGKPTFKVDGKTYKVTGDTRDEKQQVDEREMKDKEEFDQRAEPGDYYKSNKGKVIKTEKGVRHERGYEDDEDNDEDDRLDRLKGPKLKGRPKGTKRAIGAKVKGTSKLHSKPAIKEGDLEEDYDRDEYDEEGEMAKSQARTIADAAMELHQIVGDNENLPEWVQKKIALAQEYIDAARDYLVANRPEEQEIMAEKAVSKAQRAAAGIAYAAKKGEIPKSELRGASKEMAKMPAGELKKFAKTKEKGLPEKKDEAVEETTVSGSVATAPAEAPKGKKGMIFGKGVYESQLAEGFDRKLNNILNESMSINMSVDEDGKKSLTVNASDDDAMKLAQLLKLAGMESAHGYQDACSACGQSPCGCDSLEEADYANSPDTEEADTDTMVNGLSGGLNGQKLQSNPNNMADNPLAMRDLGKGPYKQLNLGKVSEDIKVETETRLMDLYKRIS